MASSVPGWDAIGQQLDRGYAPVIAAVHQRLRMGEFDSAAAANEALEPWQKLRRTRPRRCSAPPEHAVDTHMAGMAGQFASVRDSVMQGLVGFAGWRAAGVAGAVLAGGSPDLVSPLLQLRADMRNIAQSLQLNQPVSAQGRGEVADAARAFNQLLDAMRGACWPCAITPGQLGDKARVS